MGLEPVSRASPEHGPVVRKMTVDREPLDTGSLGDRRHRRRGWTDFLMQLDHGFNDSQSGVSLGH